MKRNLKIVIDLTGQVTFEVVEILFIIEVFLHRNTFTSHEIVGSLFLLRFHLTTFYHFTLILYSSISNMYKYSVYVGYFLYVIFEGRRYSIMAMFIIFFVRTKGIDKKKIGQSLLEVRKGHPITKLLKSPNYSLFVQSILQHI